MSLEQDILIERFLKKELSETENNEVLERMNSDVFFKEKVLLEQQFFEALNEDSWSFALNTDPSEVKQYVDLFKSDEVKSIEESISRANENVKKKRFYNYKKWSLYSSAAVVALFVSIYIFNIKEQTPKDIYYSYISTIELPSIVNRGNGNQFKKLSQGQNHFENKDYLKAVNIFSEALENRTTNSNIYLYLAISQMELNQFQDAEKTLNSLINSDLIDTEKGYWLKSLLYLKSKQIEKAKKTLSVIIKNDYYNHKKAKVLLKEITDL